MILYKVVIQKYHYILNQIFELILGLGRSCDILQMALVDISRKHNSWSQYMQPTQRIHSGASRVNKLTIVNKKLCYNGVECENVLSSPKGIDNLVGYLQRQYPKGVVLIAHNGARFDFPLLKRDLQNNENFLESNYDIECVDSIKIFKKHFPALEAYNQPYLIERFLGSENVSDAHEAVGDCENLRDALERAAQEKNLSMAEFLEIPCKKLIEDCDKGKSNKRQAKSKTPKVKRLEQVDMIKERAGKKRTSRYYHLRRR